MLLVKIGSGGYVKNLSHPFLCKRMARTIRMYLKPEKFVKMFVSLKRILYNEVCLKKSIFINIFYFKTIKIIRINEGNPILLHIYVLFFSSGVLLWKTEVPPSPVEWPGESGLLNKKRSITNSRPMVMMEVRFSMVLVSSMIMCRATTNISTSSSVSLPGLHRSLKNSMPITMLKTISRNSRNAPCCALCSQKCRNGSHKEMIATIIAIKTMADMIRSRKKARSAMVFLLIFLRFNRLSPFLF